MKNAEELNALKEEFEALNAKLAELTKEELEQVAGGGWNPFAPEGDGKWPYSKDQSQDNPIIIGNHWGPHWGE